MPQNKITSYNYNDLWDSIKEKIRLNQNYRYPWGKILGTSLSELILINKAQGYSPEATFYNIINTEELKNFLSVFPRHSSKVKENIKISVSARFGESNRSQRILNQKGAIKK